MFGKSSRGSLVLLVAFVLSVTAVTNGLNTPPLAPIQDSVMVPERDDLSMRLPNDTIPIRYDVFLTTRIHVPDFSYDGHVDIAIKCLVPTSTIVVHNRISEILKVVLKSGATETEVTTFQADAETEFLTIPLASPLVADQEYTLSITFTGQHTVDNVGWYRASYTNDEGEEIFFATSDFEAPDARQAFPCYDEPDKKAIFRFEITNHASFHAISNMPIIATVPKADGFATTTFEDTPPMSTYLLAFVVSDFESNCKADARGRQECVYARPNGMHLTPWPLETAVLGLVELEKLLNVDYSLPKMDQIAIPDKDFASGAMENWGLVTYRESRLLIDESSYNYKEKDYIGTVILHEFAHQWFGDLVSPKWWTYLWLNEGFATLFEYYATHKVYPDMRMPDLMPLECMHNIMVTDAGDNPRPMTHYVETKVNIRSLFDYVSYQKAGTILRMMMLALGDETFLKGLTYYLQEMSFKNSVAEDLFEGIQKSVDEFKALPAGLDVKTIMNSWSLQGGYPLITATRDSETKVTLTQNKFKVNDPATPLSDFYIPITHTDSYDASFDSAATQDWFRGDAAKHELTVTANSSWYILNKQQASYYRVNYDENNWRNLAAALKSDAQEIHLLNRAQLIDDSLDLAINNRLNVTIAFDILQHLSQETDYIPWGAAENGLLSFYNKLKLSDSAPAFNEFLVNMTGQLYETYKAVASPNDVYFTHLARNLAIRWACRVGNAACQADASAIMADHYQTGKQIDKNLADIMPCAAFRTMDLENFEIVYGLLDSSMTTTAARIQAIDTMVCTYNALFIETLLQKTIESDTAFLNSERTYLFQQFVKRDLQSLEITLEFMKQNSDLLKSVISVADITSIFTQMATASYSNKLSATILEVAKEFENNLGSAVIATIETQLNTNLAWMAQYGDLVIAFITQEDGEPDGANTIVVSSLLLVVALVMSMFRL